jgi:membrane-bound lytic murein transglycosylase F
LENLRRQGIEFELRAAPETLETEAIIDGVADGAYDLTVADSHILEVELAWRDDVRAAFAIGDSVAHGWAVREGDEKLLAAIDSYFRREYRGLFYNITYNKYFRDPGSIREQAAERPARTGTLSAYDSLFQLYAERYDFDWRLIAAQAYQESRFRPQARSFAGAVGLMQVMPGTARELGFDSPLDPETSVHAGVKYLRRLYDRLDELSSSSERTWFALAAYNAGFGHLRDARRLAGELGRDPDRWFGQVEAVMPLLARARYYRQARFGYCRCGEPVAYVRAIRDRYRAYSDVVAASY